MKRVIAGMDPAVAKWVWDGIPGASGLGDGPYATLGLINGEGWILAGIVYTVYTGNDILLNIRLVSKQAMSRGFIEAGFRYPFIQLGVSRVTVMVSRRNKASRSFVVKLGWKLEGCLREWYGPGEDAMVYGMLRRECRWLAPRRVYGHAESAPAGGPRGPGRRVAATNGEPGPGAAVPAPQLRNAGSAAAGRGFPAGHSTDARWVRPGPADTAPGPGAAHAGDAAAAADAAQHDRAAPGAAPGRAGRVTPRRSGPSPPGSPGYGGAGTGGDAATFSGDARFGRPCFTPDEPSRRRG